MLVPQVYLDLVHVSVMYTFVLKGNAIMSIESLKKLESSKLNRESFIYIEATIKAYFLYTKYGIDCFGASIEVMVI